MNSILQLFEAIKVGDLSKVRFLLDSDPQLLSSRDDQGVSAILTAVYYHQQEMVGELLAHGPELDIWEASAIGQSSRLTALLDQDETLLDRYSPDGFTPLGLSAFFGKLAVLETLVARGADVNLPSRNPMQVRPIHSAVAHRDPAVALQMAQVLLDNGVEVNVTQTGGFTPLHEAANHGNIDMVRLLIHYGAIKSARSDDGRTPLDIAQQGHHDAVVALLQS